MRVSFWMFLLSKTQDPKDMTAEAPFGPGFPPYLAEKAHVMEIYATSFNDPHDETLFVLRSDSGRVVAEARVPGY